MREAWLEIPAVLASSPASAYAALIAGLSLVRPFSPNEMHAASIPYHIDAALRTSLPF